jgi:signal transduction histidine kinase
MAADPDVSPVLRSIQVGQHLLFAVLLLLGAVRAWEDAAQPGWVLSGTAALAIWYAAGRWLLTAGQRYLWLAGLVAGWLALVALSPDFSWVAFALFFRCMQLLPIRLAVGVVAALTAVVVAAEVSRGNGQVGPQVIGPSLGALVAIGIALAYRRLISENEQRRRLVAELVAAQDDLVSTHDELAATQRQAGALAERARLARDIHDTLAQGFSSILLLARAGRAGPAATAEVATLLGQIEATAAENLDEARRVVHALAPAALEDAPLPAAIGRLLDRLAEQTGVRAELHLDGEPVPIATSQEVALLRLAQSALANVRLHAQASRVAVTLTYRPSEVSLDVVDDGVGFDLQQLQSARLGGTGFGLRAMRDRLSGVGGTLAVESSAGEGTAVAATIPLARQGSGSAH